LHEERVGWRWRVPRGHTGAAWFALSWAAAGIAWFFSAYLVTRGTGIRSAWFGIAGALTAYLSLLLFVVQSAAQGMLGSAGFNLAEGLGSLAVVVAAALAGTELAIRRRPATLSADEPQYPAAPDAPLDTAGDSDG